MRTTGFFASSGKLVTVSTADFRSLSAFSGEIPELNCVITVETDSFDDDPSSVIPFVPFIASSMGFVTRSSTSFGLAPGRIVVTETIGILTECGS